MSDTYTWPQRCPDLVQDVSLKRARIDNEDGTSTIRTTSSSSTDVTAITQALGNQADTISQPSVIGLLKNLVANSGGSGGETSSYPVFKSELYQIVKSYQPNTTVLLSSLLPSGASVPEWTKYIIFFPFTNRTQGEKIFLNGPIIVNKTIEAPLCINVKNKTIDTDQYKIVSTDYFFLYVLQDNKPAIQYINSVISTITYPLSSSTSSNITTSCITSTSPAVIPFQIIFLDKDPLEITGGGGGSGEAISTYNLTINNVSATNITAPLSTPPSTDDQTLTTVSYLKDLLNSMNLQRRQVLVTGQITYFNVGTTYNLESTFNITIPSWANRLRMGVQISTYGTTQGYTEFGLVSGTYTYTALNNETNNYFIVNFSYNSSNKSITVNKIMRLNDSDDSYGPSTNVLGVISISAYGKAIF